MYYELYAIHKSRKKGKAIVFTMDNSHCHCDVFPCKLFLPVILTLLCSLCSLLISFAIVMILHITETLYKHNC